MHEDVEHICRVHGSISMLYMQKRQLLTVPSFGSEEEIKKLPKNFSVIQECRDCRDKLFFIVTDRTRVTYFH